jgi:hypothetical protein
MRKFHIHLFFVLLFFLFCENSLAKAGGVGVGGGFLDFGGNRVAVNGSSSKEILRERPIKRTSPAPQDKKAGIDGVDKKKEGGLLNPQNQNLATKKNRMTIDERRALRRQIYDAGHDVYVAPK